MPVQEASIGSMRYFLVLSAHMCGVLVSAATACAKVAELATVMVDAGGLLQSGALSSGKLVLVHPKPYASFFTVHVASAGVPKSVRLQLLPMHAVVICALCLRVRAALALSAAPQCAVYSKDGIGRIAIHSAIFTQQAYVYPDPRWTLDD
jgi:hypothetical protein